MTLLGLLVEAPEIPGPLLSGLAILALGLWVLRRAVWADRDREERRRHDEILETLAQLKRLVAYQSEAARE